MMASDPYRLAVKWLTGRNLTRRELAERLARRGLPCPPDLWVRLESQGWLSEERVVADEVSEAIRRGSGPERLAGRLRRRGVDPESIARALEALDPDEVERQAWAVAVRAGARRPDALYLARHLQRKGFGAEVVARTVRRWRQQPHDGGSPSE
jgi:SOS response regulatory protein OraA/RecX